MQMIPVTPYRTNSRAELCVFDLLRAGLPEQGFTAFHSLNLPWHAYKPPGCFWRLNWQSGGPRNRKRFWSRAGLRGCVGIWKAG
jgi:hypothetical protein